MININVGDRVLRKQDGLEYIVIYIGHNKNEHYLILQDYSDKSKKDTCEYSFDLEKDYEVIKPNKIEPLPITREENVKDGLGRTIMRYRITVSADEITSKINEIIEYINKEDK